MFDIMQRFLIVVAFRGRLLTPQVPNFHFLDEGVKKSHYVVHFVQGDTK